jgi:hypothetical protein
MFYPKVCIMQLLKVAWYRVIALFTLHFLFDDTSITILALPCIRGFSLSDQGYLKLSNHYKSTGYDGDLRKLSLGSYIRHIILNHALLAHTSGTLYWIMPSWLIHQAHYIESCPLWLIHQAHYIESCENQSIFVD